MAGSRLFTNDFLAPDPREYDPRLCARFFFNGIGGSGVGNSGNQQRCGDFNLTMPTDPSSGGTVAQVPAFTDTVHGYTRMTVPATAPNANSREWIQDRLKAQNSTLLLGDFESDCYARVRFDKSADTSSLSVPRVGFSQGHVSYTGSPTDFNCAACFVSQGSRQNWIVILASNGSLDGGAWKEVDTGIALGGWNVLGVHCNLAANICTFTIDGKIVHRETDAQYIPSRYNTRSGVGFMQDGTVAGETLGSGVTLRGRSDAAAGSEAKLDIDWIRVRHFFNGAR